MKQLIIVLLLAVLPSTVFADDIGGLAGAATLGGVLSNVGGGYGRSLLVVAGVIKGWSIGSDLEDGTYGQPAPTVTRKVMIVDAGYQDAYQYDHAPYGNHHETHRRSSYFEDGYEQHRGRSTRPAAYMIEEVTEKTAVKPYGPTVDNYTEYDWPVTPRDCNVMSVNYGEAGNCLLRHEKDLALQQKACDGKTKTATCPTGYNAGIWAGVYRRLGNELIAKQIAEQGGEIK